MNNTMHNQAAFNSFYFSYYYGESACGYGYCV